ncbi:MAG TPA: 2-oxoacid:acceptor oxidoreductase family protein [Desulfomonilaceae bacterium]|nr:2-oxoacid:acceptor oxidoreductase family protein [Desulfomonilaceae bacterium]
MMVELVLCGRGGQGIVFLTRQIGEIAAARGLKVISSETHGMAVRGGSVNSHVRIGNFHSPLIRQSHADFLLSLDASETSNNIHFLKPTGLIVENSVAADEPGVRRVDAAGLARGIGRVQLENVVLLGFASTLDGFPVSVEEIRSQLSNDSRAQIRAMNLEALESGIVAARSRK